MFTGDVAMRITSSSAQMFRSRFVQIIAMSGVIAVAACQDALAPEEVKPAELRMGQSSAASDALATLSTDLDDMTGFSLAALPDDKGKANIVGVLHGLKGHLKSGSIAACQQDVTDARTWFGSLSDVQKVEVGHVGLALDVIQAALDNASK
jgi:hypothetical protein